MILPIARGPLWIAVGLAWVGLAQLGEGLPIATAVVVIGYGATELARRRKRPLSGGVGVLGGILPLLNLLVYVALVGMTIAVQWDLALRSPAGRIGPLLVMDHGLALLLLFHLTWRTAGNLFAESPD